jgi:metal-responsive CopG/Arc/MetJ family transcriptional regulator
MRTIVDLPVTQLEALDAWCQREGVSRAEAVRRAVAEHLAKHHNAARAKAYGVWRNRRDDGSTDQEALREEWASRERDWS